MDITTHLEEKGKAALMLKPSSKRKRNNVEVLMAEESKSEASQELDQYAGEIKRLRTELAQAQE